MKPYLNGMLSYWKQKAAFGLHFYLQLLNAAGEIISHDMYKVINKLRYIESVSCKPESLYSSQNHKDTVFLAGVRAVLLVFTTEISPFI